MNKSKIKSNVNFLSDECNVYLFKRSMQCFKYDETSFSISETLARLVAGFL
jgi:hypothetical protein